MHELAVVVDRIAKRSVDQDGCWVFNGADNGAGYGVISRHNGSRLVHRIMYEHLISDIPPGLHLDHLCRNRKCCNPWHLEPVTCRVNLRRGEGHSSETHCPQGHPYDEANTYRDSRGRRCRACHREGERNRRARKKEMSNV